VVEHVLRPATPTDLATVLGLLAAADLPTGDLVGTRLDGFLLAARPDGTVLAAIGLEPHGDHGLLRSLVVAPTARGQGLGRSLVGALEDVARARGVGTLWLLTTTAADFFARLGYTPATRDAAPPAIAASSEFRRMCPASAAFMQKPLGGRAR
jgi:amino-acid N-acetyltransferase